MIPMIAGLAIGTVIATGWAVSAGGTAGMSYGLGRKYGRIICEKIDLLEDRVKIMIAPQAAE